MSGRDRRRGLEMEMGFDLARLRRSLLESSSRWRGRGRGEGGGAHPENAGRGKDREGPSLERGRPNEISMSRIIHISIFATSCRHTIMNSEAT